MAATDNSTEPETTRDLLVKPLVAFLRCIWLFIDVGTLMLRLLIFTLLYDNPQGKPELAEERQRS